MARLVLNDRSVRRFVRAAAAPALETALALPSLAPWFADGRLVGTRIVSPSDPTADAGRPRDCRLDEWPLVLDHDRVPFVSYPHEWSPAMLHAAGELTLDLAELLLADGYGLKDASPHNVQFRGAAPVFVDIASIEPRDPQSALWLPYAQFMRTFVLPLLASRHMAVTLRQLFTADREGIEPTTVYRAASWVQRLSPAMLTAVTLPSWLSGRGSVTAQARPAQRPVPADRARFTLEGILRHARRALRAAQGTPPASPWQGYSSRGPHAPTYHDHKRQLIGDFVTSHRPQRVLDLGCNDGHLAVLAAAAGAAVVAVDRDPALIDGLWNTARERRLRVLPLVVDLLAPTPALGWRNRESASFLDRARKQFDCVLMLGLLHHLVVDGGVPVAEVAALAADLTTDWLVLEWVPPDDPMFVQLLRGRHAADFPAGADAVAAAFGAHFTFERSLPMASTHRVFHVLRRR